MNKYELALVVSANVEDEVRTATIEKVNELITSFGFGDGARVKAYIEYFGFPCKFCVFSKKESQFGHLE